MTHALWTAAQWTALAVAGTVATIAALGHAGAACEMVGIDAAADAEHRSGAWRYLPHLTRDLASMRIAQRDPRRLGRVLGHVSVRVGALTLCVALLGGWRGLLAGVAVGYALDRAGHLIGERIGLALGDRDV